MSPVAAPAVLGTIRFRVHVWPRSLETKTGALAPPNGSGVKADPTIRRGSAGSIARLGSLSWFVSPLNTFGIMLITTVMTASFEALWKL